MNIKKRVIILLAFLQVGFIIPNKQKKTRSIVSTACQARDTIQLTDSKEIQAPPLPLKTTTRLETCMLLRYCCVLITDSLYSQSSPWTYATCTTKCYQPQDNNKLP